MKKATVVTHGFFGDIIFATSVAEKLKKEKGYDHVEYVIGFPQVAPLLNTEYIDELSLAGMKTDTGIQTYIGPSPTATHENADDDIYQLGLLSLQVPPTIDYQLQCDIRASLSPEYKVAITPQQSIIEDYEKLRLEHPDKIFVAVGNDWFIKGFEFTEHEYWNGHNVPNLGYGGRFRNLNSTLDTLDESKKYHFVFVGAQHSKQTDLVPLNGDLTLEQYAQHMAMCDVFLGTEGGLSNIAAGLGVPTVIDPSYVAMLYGPRGCIRTLQEPKLGPKNFFGDKKHRELSLFVNDNMTEEDKILYFADDIHNCISQVLST